MTNKTPKFSSHGGRLIKWKGRAASIAPAMLSVSLIALSSGMASGQTVISTALTTPQTIATDANVTVTSTGSVTLTNGSDDAIIEIDVSDYTADVLLDGPLTFTSVDAADSGEGLLLTGDLSGTVTNNAAITVDIADDDDIEATGLVVDGSINEGGSVSNNGTIGVTVTVSNTGTDDSLSATAYGVDVDDIDGQLSNDGSIEVTATASGSATEGLFAYAFGIDGSTVGTEGSITNDGSILVSATAEGTSTDNSIYASAYGMTLISVDGTVSNAGSIDVTAMAKGSADDEVYSTAYGIYIGSGIVADGSVTNDGTIKVTASSEGTSSDNHFVYATAYGIHYGSGNLQGQFTNNGSIDVTASATGEGTSGLSVYAYGIYGFDLTESGALTNDGSILVTATSDGTATSGSLYVSAFGILIDDIDGTLSNNGSIEVTATASGSGTDGLSAYAYGINAQDIGDNGSLTSSGSILVTATADGTATSESIYVSAFGIELSNINGTVSNAGSIEVAATAMGSGTTGLSALAYGIEGSNVDGDGSVSNTGSILVTATADGVSTDDVVVAYASGIDLDTIEGMVSNAGLIVTQATATGTGTNIEATAHGIRTEDVGSTGTVSNTGTILVTADADDLENAYGIRTGALDGTVYNSGTVLAFAANGGNATAIQVSGGSGSATFTTESLFAGRLSLTNAELTVQSVANTESIYWTFDDIPQSVILDDENGPKLFQDGNVIATVEPVNLAFSGQIAAEMANMGGGTVAALLAGAPSTVTTGMQNAEGADAAPSGMRGTVFVEGDLVSRKLDDAAGRELDFDVSGVTAGLVGRAANGMGFGLTVSGVNSKGSTASGLGRDSIDTDGIVLGAYGNTALGAASLTFGVTVGMLSNNSTRSVNDNLSENGISTVSADYDSSFISPSVELSTVMQSGAATIRPYIGYRYTRLKIDGFTETGGPAAASFDSRDVDVSDFTIGADLSMPAGQGTLTGSAQILRRVVSDDGASFAFFGDTGHTASAATDFTALELGIGYSVEAGAGMLSIGASGMVGDNGVSGYGVTAAYRLAF